MKSIPFIVTEELRDHPDAIVVVVGAEDSRPYFYCPVRQILCNASVFRQLVNDLSSLNRSNGETHRLEIAVLGAIYDWDFQNPFRISDSLTFSPRFRLIEAHLGRIIAGEAPDLVAAVGGAEPRLLWELCCDQWDQSLYLRLIAAFGSLHRQFATDDELIRRAIERNWMDVIRWLPTVGARFDQPGSDGVFPLHIAARHGNVDAVKFIVSLGVDYVPRTPDGKSPLDWAMFCPDHHKPQMHTILWPLEWPAAAAKLQKLDELTSSWRGDRGERDGVVR